MQSLKMAGTLGLCATLLTTACSDSPASLSPTAPSAISAPVAAVAGALTTEVSSANGNGHGNGNGNGNAGNGNGNGNGNGKDKNPPAAPSDPAPPTSESPAPPVAPGNPVTGKTELQGLIAGKSATTITVNSQLVLVPASTVIRHGSKTYTLADLKIGDRVHVRAYRVTSGSGATATTELEATEIKLQNPSGDGEDDDDGEVNVAVEVQGAVSVLSGVCPAVSFTVGTVRVTTGAATSFTGATCATVKNGDWVEVKGVRQADGTVLATSVGIRVEEFAVLGSLSLLSGTCPAVSFTVGAGRVTTAATTTFTNGSCAALANGTRVDVKGTLQVDGTLLASVVKIS